MVKLPAPPPGRKGWPWNDFSPPSKLTKEEDWPRISIVTPTLNQNRFIEETIRSVLMQNYPNLEYIIIDGGSTDGTLDTIKKYEKWIDFWVSESDRGQSHAINKGWNRSSGEILAWINSDDIYLPGALYLVAEKYLSSGKPAMLVGSCDITDEYRNCIAKIDSTKLKLNPEHILSGGDTPGQPSVFVSKNTFEMIGPLNENYNYTMDWDYWIRIVTQFASTADNIITIPDSLAAFNNWDEGKIISSQGIDLDERRVVLKDFFSDSNHESQYGHLKKSAIANTYYRQGRSYFQAEKIAVAIKSWIHAFLLDPIRYNPITMLYTNFDLLIPKKIRSLFSITFGRFKQL